MAKLRIESMGKNSKMVNSCSSAMLVIGDDDLIELILVLSMKALLPLCSLSLILQISDQCEEIEQIMNDYSWKGVKFAKQKTEFHGRR
ncbi:unnamed protein product [Cuscuta epithymum]|uniref:Uncharacterized protein n=1 Tax=Cuscuta epithymum TaxID=186058 RepID=A0AAV0D5B6_9ASTE|nr:unnamed protein product [Cuscuta epithymum]